jgi:hypothetical protein
MSLFSRFRKQQDVPQDEVKQPESQSSLKSDEKYQSVLSGIKEKVMGDTDLLDAFDRHRQCSARFSEHRESERALSNNLLSDIRGELVDLALQRMTESGFSFGEETPGLLSVSLQNALEGFVNSGNLSHEASQLRKLAEDKVRASAELQKRMSSFRQSLSDQERYAIIFAENERLAEKHGISTPAQQGQDVFLTQILEAALEERGEGVAR